MRRPSTRLAGTGASAFIGLVLALSVISPAHAAGAGLQFKLASWGRRDSLAMRIEYERFTFAGANPYLVSVGANWTFL